MSGQVVRICMAWAMLGLFAPQASWAADRAAELQRFERKIRPLLVKRCSKCHSGPKPKAGLNLVDAGLLMSGGRSGPAIVPGNPTGSLLVQAIRRRGKKRMPPDVSLESGDVLELVTWIKNGAVVPVADGAGKREPGGEITDDDRQWWSFRPLDPGVVPVVPGDRWSRSAIDRYIQSRLHEEKLEPSGPSTPRAWIRRATFDLWGLPPTPEAVRDFESDTDPGAFARVVDRLLASPRYGERWARHWLDVVRYADTNGGGFDFVYPTAWRYRDYVVRALNLDIPYDSFLVEQLAGDLLPETDDEARALDRKLATGMLTLAPKGLGMQDKELMAMDVVDDQIDVLGRSLMGLTLACARCHDHKFDPVLTADYYALAGIFRSTVFLSDLSKNPSYWPEQTLQRPSVRLAREQHDARTQATSTAISKIVSVANQRLVVDARKRLDEYLLVAAVMHHTRGDRGAVAHWTFDGLSGKSVAATTGPAGILANTSGKKDAEAPTRIEDGQVGRALRFGAGKIVEIEANSLKPIALGRTDDFSVGVWLRAPSGYKPATADSIVAANYKSKALWFIALRPGVYNGVYLRHYNGSAAVDIKPSSNLLPVLTDGKWHHLAVTSDRDAAGILYVDGKQAGRTSIAAVSATADYGAPVSMKLGASTNRFAGDLDDVAIWDRVLDPAEIIRLFDLGHRDDNRQDVGTIERQRPRKDGAPSVGELLKSHRLVPSLARGLSREILAAAGKPGAALHDLALEIPENVGQVRSRVDLDSPELAKRLDGKQTLLVPGSDAEAFYPAEERRELATLKDRSARLAAVTFAKPVMAMVAFDSKKPSDLRVHVGGDNRRLGEVVSRGFPRVLLRKDQPAVKIPQATSGRLELARWLTRVDHPLAVRVMVNRVWQWHFGEGLVRTPDNFGQLGEEPSHPRLLDHLAQTFIRDGWSLKRLHSRILLSAVYRQASASREGPMQVDADNRWLWRMSRRRLEAEPFRDAMLAVSGGLDSRMYGTLQSWKPREFSVDDANKETANFKTRRRSLYLPVVRTTLHQMMELFDVGDPNSITSRRANTTVPHQALFLLNNPFVRQRSRGLAERVMAWSDDEEQQVERAWWLVLSRPPSTSEMSRARQFLAGTRQSESADGRQAWTSLAWALFSLNEMLYVD